MRRPGWFARRQARLQLVIDELTRPPKPAVDLIGLDMLLEEVIYDAYLCGKDTGITEPEAREELVERFEALVRPAEGIVLSPTDAANAGAALGYALQRMVIGNADRREFTDLAKRLAAAR